MSISTTTSKLILSCSAAIVHSRLHISTTKANPCRATRVDFVCDAQQAGVLTSASEPESCDYVSLIESCIFFHPCSLLIINVNHLQVFKVSSSAACGKQPAPEGPCTASESLVVQCGERSFPMYKTFSSTLSITTTTNVTAAWYLNLNTDVTRVECGADIRGAAV